MSEMATLEVLEGGKSSALKRVVTTAKRMEEHEEIDRWEFADDVQEAVEERVAPETVSGAGGNQHQSSGFYAAIDEVNDEIRKAGVLTVGRDAIVGSYKTAKAWPPGERVEGANYWAHYELRALEYDRRRAAILKKLVRRSTTGRVGTQAVRLWKSDRRSADMTPREEKLERWLRAALRRWATPQQFAALHEDEKKQASRLLYRLAREIDEGSFK